MQKVLGLHPRNVSHIMTKVYRDLKYHLFSSQTVCQIATWFMMVPQDVSTLDELTVRCGALREIRTKHCRMVQAVTCRGNSWKCPLVQRMGVMEEN